MRRLVVLGVFFALLLPGATGPLDQAQKLYSKTDYDGSLRVLNTIAERTGDVYDLMGRSYYMQGDYRHATEYLEKAVAADPESSQHALWLGRAYGRRAETSSVVTAPRYASRARQAFEKAVELDGGNLEAVNDLFEYYLEAPGFLGGGYDKAANLAQRIAKLDPVEGFYARAKLAEKRKEYGSAEEQFRRAADLAPQQVGRLIDLAKILAKQGKYQESEQSFQRAAKIAPNSPKLLYERAAVYVDQNRNLDLARNLLKQYLGAQLTPDDPPRTDAQKLLQKAGG
jgi:tetratricopeptide (TPR) repeat protein